MMIHWDIWRIVYNAPLMSGVVAMAAAQIFKTIAPIFKKDDKFDWKKLFYYGGFPSGHTTFISAMAAGVGFSEGWDSALFAAAGVIASILIYDILKSRPIIEINRDAVLQLEAKGMVTLPEKKPQFKSHTLGEVAAGLVFGVVSAAVVCYFFSV